MNRPRQHLRIAAALLGAVVVLVAAPASQAHKKSYASTITASVQNKNFADGTVASPNAKCIANRVVTVYSPSGAALGTAKTDAQGKWRVGSNYTAGTYTATVAKRTILKNRKHNHKCLSATASFVVS